MFRSHHPPEADGWTEQRLNRAAIFAGCLTIEAGPALDYFFFIQAARFAATAGSPE